MPRKTKKKTIAPVSEKKEEVKPQVPEAKLKAKPSGLKLKINLIKDCIETAIPEIDGDEIILKCRKVRTISNDIADGYIFGPDEQITVQTGIESIDGSDEYAFMILPINEYMEKHEVATHPEPVICHGELSVILFCHGHSLNIEAGMPVGRLILRKCINVKAEIK